MLSGFNTNIRHRGVLFHVQTEDSGRRNPRIITHLYHRGTILASEKRDYSDKLGAADLEAEVKGLMEGQHRAMLARLKQGEFDARIDEHAAGEATGTDATSTRTQPDPAGLAPRPAPGAAAARAPRPFGQGIVSEKPLDEVVLEYLVDNARKRKRGPR